MESADSISDHWAQGDVYRQILEAMAAASLSLDAITVEQMAPMDHFHARGFQATVELADALEVGEDDHILDIGSGLGGPARYLAKRYGCRVSGIDITAPFVEAANKLTELLKMEGAVAFKLGDGQHLLYDDVMFDGAYTQHVTMNVADRSQFFTEAYRVLKPGAFFALTEHGLGPHGDPIYPCPWSEDGSGAYLMTPEETLTLLEKAGFVGIQLEETGPKYVSGYKQAMGSVAKGSQSAFGTHILMGETAGTKTKNSARNIEEGRTRPIQIICSKPG